MRVPTLDAPRVARASLPTYNQASAQTDTSVLRGLGELGQGLQNLGGAVSAEMDKQAALEAKARQEAEALDSASRLLALQERGRAILQGSSGSKGRIDDAWGGVDTSKGGFLALRGFDASERSKETIDALEAAAKEAGAGITDPLARKRFELRAREQLLVFRGTVERHVAGEYEAARDSTLKAREQEALGMAEAGIPDFNAWLVASRQVESDITSLARTPAEAESRVALYRSSAALAMTRGLVAQGRLDDAAEWVKANRPVLAGNFPEAQGLVAKHVAGAEKDRKTEQLQGLVDTSLSAVRSEGAEYVTEEQLREAVPMEGYDADTRQELELMLTKAARAEGQRLRADIQRERDNANKSDVDGVPMPGVTEAFLRQHDPDFLLARQARKRAEFRAWKASKSNDAKERAAAAKAQRDVDLQFRYRLEKTLTDDPSADPAEVAQAFIAEKAKEGEDVTISATELERGGASAAKAQKRAGTEEGAREKAAAQRFERTFGPISKPGKGKPVDQKVLNERVGKAMGVYRERTEAKGAPLSESELAAIEAELVTQQEVEVPGRFFGTNTKKVPAVDALRGESTDLRLRPGPTLKPEQQRAVEQALEWARSHPNDPRAAAILRKLGQQPR